MSATLDLDDVAATSPTAAAELAQLRALLGDCRGLLAATQHLFDLLPVQFHAGHLSTRTAALVDRIDAVLALNYQTP